MIIHMQYKESQIFASLSQFIFFSLNYLNVRGGDPALTSIRK